MTLLNFRTALLALAFVALVTIGPVACDDSSQSSVSPGASGSTAASAAGKPPIFDSRPYEDAKAAANLEGKLFLVKATAEWCGPCKQMDATTWRDPNVVSWLKDRAVVVAVDVDKERAVAQSLGIRAMPTMILFSKDGDEFDRVVGYRSPEDLLAWLNGTERGERAIDQVRRDAGSRDSGGAVNVESRLQLARSLVQQGSFAEATDEYVWLWDNMLKHNPAMAGVRGSFMAADMEQLAATNDDAKAKFTVLRDAAQSRLSESSSAANPMAMMDFICLNRVVGDEDATLAWIDEVKGDPAWKESLTRGSYFVKDLLIENGRWADLGAILFRPAELFEQQAAMLSMAQAQGGAGGQMDEATLKMMKDFQTESLRTDASAMYAALVAAGRADEATKLANVAMRLDDSPAMVRAIVERALVAESPRAEQLEWIKIAESKDPSLAELRSRLERALAN